MPAIKAILWDNDGVLVDTEFLYRDATREVLATIGIELTDEQYRELFLKQNNGAWHLAAERGTARTRLRPCGAPATSATARCSPRAIM